MLGAPSAKAPQLAQALIFAVGLTYLFYLTLEGGGGVKSS